MKSLIKLAARFNFLRKFFYAIILSILLTPTISHAANALAMYDKPLYDESSTHFNYTDPNAKRGGTLFLANPDRRTSFDKFNPFSLKGIAAPGIDTLMFETLAVGSEDEPASMYGLLAKKIQLAADHLSITFTLHEQAHFNNGQIVLAKDVCDSFNTLRNFGSPQYALYFSDIKNCEALSKEAVRFQFKHAGRELPFVAGTVPVFSKIWGQGKTFAKIGLVEPISSGPYRIENYQTGRAIRFKRDPNYWADHLSKPLLVRRGMFNFDHVQYRLYKDDIARLEAFKVGEFDATVEYSAKNWVRHYQGQAFANGNIIKRELKHHNVAGMQGFAINLRRPLFQDIRVRKALWYALDFEWMNRQLFYNQYQRSNSFFSNSDLAAQGSPSQAERALLEPLRSKLDDSVWDTVPEPPRNDIPLALRKNLETAQQLLAQAGWHYRDGALRNAKDEVFAFEILDDQGVLSRIIAVYIRNLKKLGMQVAQRTVDYTLMQKRMEQFDFDITTIRFADGQIPGVELRDRFSSQAATQMGSSNYFGLKDAAVDQLIESVLNAKDMQQLQTASQALDRVLRNKVLVIPHWYAATHRLAYHNKIALPEQLSLYYQADEYVLKYGWLK